MRVSTNLIAAGPRLSRERLGRRILRHHLPLGAVSGIAIVVLYFTRPYPDPVMRGSFSTAYPALFLLLLTLVIGPLQVLLRRRVPVSQDLRRDVGIWAGMVTMAHVVIGQQVHFRGRPWLYYVYPAGQHHWVPIRHDLFGVTNYAGAIGTLLLLALFVTSNDLLLRRLGTPGWKKVQRLNYAVFALVAVHTFGFMAIENQKVPFVTVAALGVGATMILQAAGYLLRRSRG